MITMQFLYFQNIPEDILKMISPKKGKKSLKLNMKIRKKRKTCEKSKNENIPTSEHVTDLS